MADNVMKSEAISKTENVTLENGDIHCTVVTTKTAHVSNGKTPQNSVVIVEHHKFVEQQLVGEPVKVIEKQLCAQKDMEIIEFSQVENIQTEVVGKKHVETPKSEDTKVRQSTGSQDVVAKRHEISGINGHADPSNIIERAVKPQTSVKRKEAALVFEKFIEERSQVADSAKVEQQDGEVKQEKSVSEKQQQKTEPKEQKMLEKRNQTLPPVVEEEKETDSESSGSSISEPERKNFSENEPLIRTDVLREADNNDEDEYPEEGLAKTLLSKFQNLETEAKSAKQKELKRTVTSLKRTFPQLRPTYDKIDASHSVDIDDIETDEQGGVYESQPTVRDDVAKEEHRNDDEELPPIGLTKNLLTTFKELQKSGENTPVRQRSRVGSTSSIAETLSLFNESGGSYSENSPQFRKDVVRETDELDDSEELPTQGTTKNLLGMFSQVTESAQKMSESLHKPSGVASKQWKSKRPLTRPLTRPTDSGEAEDTHQTGAVKEDTGHLNEKELPKSGYAKGLLQKFKTMESSDKGNKSLFQQAWTANTSKLQSVSAKKEQLKVANKTKQDEDNNKIEESASVTEEVASLGEPGIKDSSKSSQRQEQTSNQTSTTEVVEEEQIAKKKSAGKSAGKSSAKSSAMSRFLEMESKERTSVQYNPSIVARKSLRDLPK